ncbi:hypothetical protein FB451DRAFT_187047 [Mycena latifolia]|nr:hypothetical protein FB451DRAFT_187047 [Mycena latifolia]
MAQEPAAKRKRTETDLPNDTPPVRSKIWMPYGDIILQAESTQFRVNRDILAHQSSVFRDMFSVPQPQNEPTFEGCPIVHVSDAAKDWEMFLHVLYNPFPSISKVKQPFPALASMLRLGRKYEIQAAKDDVVARIHSEFPADFAAWKELGHDGLTHIDDGNGIYIQLLNLVYECGIYTSIPVLGLCCLNMHRLEVLFTGLECEDGSLVTIASDGIKLTMALALERILLFQRESMAWLNDDVVVPHTSCSSQTQCEEQKILLNHTVTWREPTELDFTYTLDPWEEEWSGKLCDACEEAAKASYETSRQKGWDLLPSFFGLPEWKHLKDAD